MGGAALCPHVYIEDLPKTNEWKLCLCRNKMVAFKDKQMEITTFSTFYCQWPLKKLRKCLRQSRQIETYS